MTKKEQQKARYEALVQAAFTLSDLVDVACDDAKGTLEWDVCPPTARQGTRPSGNEPMFWPYPNPWKPPQEEERQPGGEPMFLALPKHLA